MKKPKKSKAVHGKLDLIMRLKCPHCGDMFILDLMTELVKHEKDKDRFYRLRL